MVIKQCMHITQCCKCVWHPTADLRLFFFKRCPTSTCRHSHVRCLTYCHNLKDDEGASIRKERRTWHPPQRTRITLSPPQTNRTTPLHYVGRMLLTMLLRCSAVPLLLGDAYGAGVDEHSRTAGFGGVYSRGTARRTTAAEPPRTTSTTTPPAGACECKAHCTIGHSSCSSKVARRLRINFHKTSLRCAATWRDHQLGCERTCVCVCWMASTGPATCWSRSESRSAAYPRCHTTLVSCCAAAFTATPNVARLVTCCRRDD